MEFFGDSMSSKFINFVSNIFKYKEKNTYNFVLPDADASQDSTINDSNSLDSINSINKNLDKDINKNLEYINSKYNTLINSDIKIREFVLTINNKQYKSFIFYIDGMIDTDIINRFVLNSLMLEDKSSILSPYTNKGNSHDNSKVEIKKNREIDLVNYISNCLLPQNDVSKKSNFNDIFPSVNIGMTALFVDTIDVAFMIDAKGFEKRSIVSPENEKIIRGSQESFIESIRTNTSLIRRLVNNENLIIESLSIGEINRNNCAICYVKNIANDDLVAEVKYRLNNLDVDYVISSGQLEQLIEDKNFSLPQLISTERPDKAASYLLEGRVVIILNGTPYVLVAPAVFIDFLSSPEDKNLKFQFADLLKIVRIIAFIVTLLLPGLYIGITTFHEEIIPTELLFAILASRNGVPFPIIFEILTMEISLELIRESGVRVPSPLGQTISIVGALILGEAAVSAKIVSPLLVIVVAITGITAFAVPDYSLSFHVRLARFIYIILGYFAGFLGIAFGLTIHLAVMASINSFGVSYLSPFAPVFSSKETQYFIEPIWKQESRKGYISTKKNKKEEHISMKWKKGDV